MSGNARYYLIALYLVEQAGSMKSTVGVSVVFVEQIPTYRLHLGIE